MLPSTSPIVQQFMQLSGHSTSAARRVALALDGPRTIMGREARGKRDDIADALVRTLCVNIAGVLAERMPKRPFTKQDQPRQGFIIHRAHPPIRIRIQIRRSWRQGDSRHSPLHQ